MVANTGAHYEIRIDGVSRTWRDLEVAAYEAARNLRHKNIGARITVVDLRTGTETAVEA